MGPSNLTACICQKNKLVERPPPPVWWQGYLTTTAQVDPSSSSGKSNNKPKPHLGRISTSHKSVSINNRSRRNSVPQSCNSSWPLFPWTYRIISEGLQKPDVLSPTPIMERYEEYLHNKLSYQKQSPAATCCYWLCFPHTLD